jgi:hypothetical protein
MNGCFGDGCPGWVSFSCLAEGCLWVPVAFVVGVRSYLYDVSYVAIARIFVNAESRHVFCMMRGCGCCSDVRGRIFDSLHMP